MSHQWSVLASAYFDNELEPSEKDWFEKHLFSCKECALDLEAFKTIQRVIQSVKIEGYPFGPRDPFEDATRT